MPTVNNDTGPIVKRIAVTLMYVAACIAVLYVPGIIVGAIRRVVELSGFQYWVADASALAVVATTLALGFRLVPKGEERPRTAPWMRAVITLSLAFCTAASLRGIVMYFQMQGVAPSAGPVPELEGVGGAAILTILMIFVIQPTVFEETAVRAYLLPRLASAWTPAIAIAGSAAVGTAIHWHLDRFSENLWALALGSVTLSAVMQFTRSLSVVVLAHFMFNLSGLLLDFYASGVANPGDPIVTAYEMLIGPTSLLALSLVAAAVAAALCRLHARNFAATNQ